MIGLNPSTFQLVAMILAAFVIVWLSILTYRLLRVNSHYTSLVKGSKGDDLKKILEKMMAKETENHEQLEKLFKKVHDLETAVSLHIQKVGFNRFNPFQETGGEHSFSICLLDGNDNGFILTGLHTRERTRVYAKPVLKGESDLELSAEEKKALSQAIKV